jgi:hypothetical protein
LEDSVSIVATEPDERRRDWRITEDLAEYRAYLQRGETRLSTLHRVAGAFLGGAGLLTLLPVLFRDTFSSLFSHFLFLNQPGIPQPGSLQRWLTLVPVLLSLVLPLWALYLLVRDLVQFYFTGHHFGDRANAITYPRFILSGILVPADHLHNKHDLDDAREERAVTELLVPESAKARSRLLKEAHVLLECRGVDESSERSFTQDALKSFLFRYTASMKRSLPQESAKMEASLARHHALLRVLVLRYAKAFLLTILTTGTTITVLVILNLLRPGTRAELTGATNLGVLPDFLVWYGALSVYAAWCLAAAWIVRRPVVWIYDELADSTKSLRTPQSLIQFERWTLGAVAVGALTVATCVWWYAFELGHISAFWVAAAITSAFTITTLAYAFRTLPISSPNV